MKNIMLLIAVSLFGNSFAQSFVDTKGKVHFFSKAAVEDIEATSLQTVCALSTDNKKVFAKIPIKSFEFSDKLMQEHFNENYLESDKIPYATLDAVISESIDFTKDGVYDVTLVGTFEIHAVKKPVNIKGKLTIADGVPTKATADFMVVLADHKIKIPKIVMMSIAETIKVDVAFNFTKYEKK